MKKSKRGTCVLNQQIKSKCSSRISSTLFSLKTFPISKRSTRVSNQITINKFIPVSKRSQAWGIDLTVGAIIFFSAILIFFIYSVNHSGEAKENLEGLSYEGDVLFSNILSEGYPQNWNEANVVKLGILDNGRINQTKLEMFYNLAYNNYTRTKSIFNLRHDYYFYFTNMSINSTVMNGIGKPETNWTNINATNLIKITRFTIYQDEPKTVYLFIWEK